MLFNAGMWGGGSCATYYGYKDAPGVSIRFDQPFVEHEGRKCASVETSKGPIYFRFNMNRKYLDRSLVDKEPSFDTIVPSAIEHYSVNELTAWGMENRAQVGVCLLADGFDKYNNLIELTVNENDKKYYASLAEQYKLVKENLEKKLAPILLYKSEPFFNMIHPYGIPYCSVYVYDKEMKHEV